MCRCLDSTKCLRQLVHHWTDRCHQSSRLRQQRILGGVLWTPQKYLDSLPVALGVVFPDQPPNLHWPLPWVWIPLSDGQMWRCTYRTTGKATKNNPKSKLFYFSFYPHCTDFNSCPCLEPILFLWFLDISIFHLVHCSTNTDLGQLHGDLVSLKKLHLLWKD